MSQPVEQGCIYPKSLYALIVTYQPSTSGQSEVGTKTVDLGATAIAKYGEDLLRSEKADTAVEGKEKGEMDEMKEK